jgi:hypothetical protein
MIFDAKVPSKLKRTQLWFGSIIGRPIDEDSRMNPISPSGQSMEIEACDYIRPSPSLRPAQRIQIYNQQYWWRLLNSMHESFPLVTRLFGYHDFNRMIAIPYLVKYPPNHWSLNEISNLLPQWVQEEYHENDKQLILDSSKIDWAFMHSFCAEQKPPILTSNLPQGDPSSLLNNKIYMQTHLHLFAIPYELFNFRMEFLKQEPEYWIEHDFPELKKEQHYHFALFRNAQYDIEWMNLTKNEFEVLSFLKSGKTIDDICEWIEKQDSTLIEEAKNNLGLWFQKWIVLHWLTLQN